MKNLLYLALLLINVIALAPSKSFAIGADDGKLRTLRLALSCTGDYAAFFGGTKAGALAGMVNTVTRLNGVFEKDFGVKLILIANNDAVIYTDPLTDPYTYDHTYRGSQLQSTLTTVIGEANYDIGHVFGGTMTAGSANCIGCVCVDGTKGSGYSGAITPSGDFFDIDLVSHEMGHQLGATHTFTHKTEGANIAQMEPGGGSTIMSYAGKTGLNVASNADSYFHAISIQQITNNVKTKTCPIQISTGNAVPVVNAGLDYTIPKGTPFMLTGSATDANTNDVLTYSWEQMDLGTATTSIPSATSIAGPLFRSLPAVTSPIRYFPKMATILTGSTSTLDMQTALLGLLPTEILPTVARTLNFRLTVRDNRAGGGANNADDVVLTVDANSGPFTVDSQNSAVSYPVGSSQAVNWSVAGTNANGVNCSSVDILLSTNGGQTFPIVLASAVPNNGSANIIIPNIPGATNRIMVKGTNHIFFDVNNANFIIGSGGADTIAPTAPALSSSGLTSSSVNLSWSGATDNIGVVGYDVYQNGVFKSSVSGTSFSVSGLSASTAYSFYVKAKDAAGNVSPASNTVSITTLALADTIAPSAAVLASSGLTSSSVNLSWSGATDNVGVVGYDVYQNGSLKSSVSGTSLSVSGLSASTSYSFYVKAKDAAGNISPSSNVVNVTTLTALDTIAPSAAVLASSGLTSSSVNLSWSGATDNVGVTGYDVYQNGSLKSSVSGTSLTVSGLSPSTSYNFYVIAKDAAGNRSVASNSVNVTTLVVAVSDLAVDLLLPANAVKRTTIQFSATATSSAGINRVEFYVKGSLVCSDSAPAYTCSWKAPGKAGTYSVEARAVDNAGNQKSSIKSLLVQ